MNLFQIANQYTDIFTEVDENGEITDEMLGKLNDIGGAMETKAIAIASFIRNLEAERDAVNKAKKAIALREQSLNNKVERLEEYLLINMEKCGISEISSSPYFTIKLKKNPVSVNILDEDFVPDNYKKTKVVTTVSVDKIKIKEAILSGDAVPGAVLQQNLRLEIK